MNQVKERFLRWALSREGELPKDSHAWDYTSIKTFLSVFDGLMLVPQKGVCIVDGDEYWHAESQKINELEKRVACLEHDTTTDATEIEKRVAALEDSHSYLNAQFNAATRLLKEY